MPQYGHGHPEPAPAPVRGISRRGVLLGLAAALTAVSNLSASPAMAAPAKVALAAPAKVAAKLASILSAAAGGPGSHSNGLPRGLDIAVTSGRSAQGRFGLMFPSLKPFAPTDALLDALAQQMIDRTEPLTDVILSNDGFDNPYIPAGFTYLGQFIDHDMTHDMTPLGDQKKDPQATLNFDTPFFDLGSVYGRGPALDPQLYDPADKRLMRLGVGADGLPDLPRDASGTAFVGDSRNDENLVIAQLQLAFLQLHNSFVKSGQTFQEAQRLTRWHFQWLIVNEFLPRIAGADVVNSILSAPAGKRATVTNRFYKPKNKLRPMMPVEYSGAAYRFGHSMIRAEYEMFEHGTIPLFGGPKDLQGSRPIPDFARIDWNYFFTIPGLDNPDDRNMTRQIDTRLSLPLAELPPTVVAHVDGAILSLAKRNLVRGRQLGLPSGQDVAAAMGITPLTNAALGLTDPAWGGKAPLWFYILKESELGTGGLSVGPVGGRIIAEVILGILATDPASYLNAPTGWAPAASYSVGHLLVQAAAITVQGHPLQTGVPNPKDAAAAAGVPDVPGVPAAPGVVDVRGLPAAPGVPDVRGLPTVGAPVTTG